MRRLLFALPFIAACCVSNAQVLHGGGRLSDDDREFMTKAAQGGRGEVELGKLAVRKGHSSRIRSFGSRMVSDHTKANRDLMRLAANYGVSLPSTMAPDEQDLYGQLRNMNGRDFDRAYAGHMLEDHQKDVADFDSERTQAKSPALRAFASRTLPTLRKHLKLAQSLGK